MSLLKRDERTLLLTLLQSIPQLANDVETREQLLIDLPVPLRTNITRSPIPSTALKSIVIACDEWSAMPGEEHPLGLLISAVCELVKGSEIEKKLQDLWQVVSARLGTISPGNRRIPSPYPGLRPFGIGDTHFYGRTKEIGEVVQRLRTSHFLMIIGPSGSGKSSLVFAGIVPALISSSYWAPGFWHIISLRPGAAPMRTITEQFGGDLANLSAVVAASLAAHRPSERLLLIVDQAEEMFAEANDEERKQFITTLTALPASAACTVVLTMRADFYPELMISDFFPLPDRKRLEVIPLRGPGLREAIKKPAEEIGVQIEAALVERLMADAEGEPGYLPLLQEVLVRMWDTRQAGSLTLEAYEQLGSDGRRGLEVVLADHADAVIDGMDEAQRTIARRIFLRLIQFGEGRRDTRRQQPLFSLRADTDEETLFSVTLKALVSNRLLTLSGQESGPQKQVDLAHEALIKSWPALQRWISEQRDAELERRRYEAAAAHWQQQGGGRSGLLDEFTLIEAQNWLNGINATNLGVSQIIRIWITTSEAARASRMFRESNEGVAVVITRQVAELTGENSRLKEEMDVLKKKLIMLDQALADTEWHYPDQARKGVSCPLCAQLLDQIAYDRVRDSYEHEGSGKVRRWRENQRRQKELQQEVNRLMSQFEVIEDLNNSSHIRADEE